LQSLLEKDLQPQNKTTVIIRKINHCDDHDKY